MGQMGHTGLNVEYKHDPFIKRVSCVDLNPFTLNP